MIKVRNLGEERIELQKAGVAASANNVDNFIVPYAGYIKAVMAGFGTMGTDGTGSPTQDIVLDIKKNGTSIFSGATKINFSHAKQVGTANTPILADNFGALTTNPTLVNKGDFLRLDITQLLNGTSPVQPSDLIVHVVIARGPTSPSAAMLTGKVDEND